MALGNLIGGGVRRSSAMLLHHHHQLKSCINSSQVVGWLLGRTNPNNKHNNTTTFNHHHHHQLCTATVSIRNHYGDFHSVTDAHKQDKITAFANFAVQMWNTVKHVDLRFVRAVAACWAGDDDLKYYITLEASDGDGGEKQFYRAIIWRKGTQLELLYWEPVDDPSQVMPIFNIFST